ncbi:IMP dehydrogenase [Candidatus Saccharibacteria bacterium]|nr:IMP dehydrogenase [Candidatus Saccharibacteria bacterium]
MMPALEKPEFFETMANHGWSSLGFSQVSLVSETSEQVRRCIETGNFDEVLIEPDLGAPYTRNSHNKLPLVSAAMDTVTESETAIVMAECGGRGTIHAALEPETQFKELEKVKKRLWGFIEEPKTLKDSMTFERVHEFCEKYTFTTFPVVDSEHRLIGIVTGHEIDRSSPSDPVTDKMKPFDQLRVSDTLVDIHEAYQIMRDEGINMLPVIDEERRLQGLYIFSDVKSIVEETSGMRNVDEKNRYVCDIAVPTDDASVERVKLCEKYLIGGGGVVVLDTAHGDGLYAFKTLKKLKEDFPDIDFMVGNVTDPDSAIYLARIGADGIKVGQASGGVCTTKDETGHGRGQVSAVWDCSQALIKAGFDTPVCSDGGIKLHGDPAKAIAAGASSVMIGTMFGGTNEAPGERVRMPDGSPGKIVRGMGSLAALQASAAAKHRYGDGKSLPLPEGEAKPVPISGDLAPLVEDFRKALRKSLLYAGRVSIEDFQRNVRMEFDFSSISK